jgi:peptide/nickel transport system substrate-binding protein
MNDKHNKLDWMIGQAKKGRMTRREFVGRTTALGVSAALAGALFSKAAMAEEPVKGGTLRLGVSGGESTNTLDPALSASPAPYNILRTWGECLVDVSETGTVEMRIAEEVSSNADATEWKFKIRSPVSNITAAAR